MRIPADHAPLDSRTAGTHDGPYLGVEPSDPFSVGMILEIAAEDDAISLRHLRARYLRQSVRINVNVGMVHAVPVLLGSHQHNIELWQPLSFRTLVCVRESGECG